MVFEFEFEFSFELGLEEDAFPGVSFAPELPLLATHPLNKNISTLKHNKSEFKWNREEGGEWKLFILFLIYIIIKWF